MHELLELFAGRGTPEQVLLAAQAADEAAAAGTVENQLFYAHYYLGAYYEATRDYRKV